MYLQNCTEKFRIVKNPCLLLINKPYIINTFHGFFHSLQQNIASWFQVVTDLCWRVAFSPCRTGCKDVGILMAGWDTYFTYIIYKSTYTSSTAWGTGARSFKRFLVHLKQKKKNANQSWAEFMRGKRLGDCLSLEELSICNLQLVFKFWVARVTTSGWLSTRTPRNIYWIYCTTWSFDLMGFFRFVFADLVGWEALSIYYILYIHYSGAD